MYVVMYVFVCVLIWMVGTLLYSSVKYSSFIAIFFSFFPSPRRWGQENLKCSKNHLFFQCVVQYSGSNSNKISEILC